MSDTQGKPREFWISKDGDGYFTDGSDVMMNPAECIHVIEYSAYENLKQCYLALVEGRVESLDTLTEELKKERAKSLVLREAVEQMHNLLVGKNHEPHISLTSNPLQNGCYVYTEWALKDIKEKALKALDEGGDGKD